MCGGGGSKKAAAPAAPVPQYYPEGRTQQDIAAATAQPTAPTFGAELGAAQPAAKPTRTTGAM